MMDLPTKTLMLMIAGNLLSYLIGLVIGYWIWGKRV
jgi:hypothetical protein